MSEPTITMDDISRMASKQIDFLDGKFSYKVNPDWCCERCTFGRGEHSDWCEKKAEGGKS